MLIARRLWGSRSLLARTARAALIPPSILYRGAVAARAEAYRFHLLRQGSTSAPTVAVGNLSVGGTGKTPIASWFAQYYHSQGKKPGIVLRGYGGDEGEVHRRLVPAAVVVENPDRLGGAATALDRGAEVIVLDDAFQRLDIKRDLNVVVLSAESSGDPEWTIPAGPWREGWGALRRADLLVVTRKIAPLSAAMDMLRRTSSMLGERATAVARLAVSGFYRLQSGDFVAPSALEGARVLVAAGVGDPDSFAAQCYKMGATIKRVSWRDHQRITDRDLNELVNLGCDADLTIVTEKDASKMRGRWPEGSEEPIVAALEVIWEVGVDTVQAALDSVVAPSHAP